MNLRHHKKALEAAAAILFVAALGFTLFEIWLISTIALIKLGGPIGYIGALLTGLGIPLYLTILSLIEDEDYL